jgi:Rieske Fe-S protein
MRGVSKVVQVVAAFTPPGTPFEARFAAPQDEVVRSCNDSQMAPQGIEIAQNGLANGELPARVWQAKSESIVRQAQASHSLPDVPSHAFTRA